MFKITRDGEMKDLKVNQPSGVSLVDSEAIEAVTKAAPFDRLPEGAPAEVAIQFTFNYNVLNQGKTYHSAEIDEQNYKVYGSLIHGNSVGFGLLKK